MVEDNNYKRGNKSVKSSIDTQITDNLTSQEGPSGYIVQKPEMDIASTNNFKELSSVDSKIHLHSLDGMLHHLSRFMYDNIKDPELRNNAVIQSYLLRVGEALDAVLLRNEVQGVGANADLQQKIVIDPTDSGFPLVTRDMFLLHADQRQAATVLKNTIPNSELVDAAINSSFQKVYPNRQIQQMLEKNYYSKLADMKLPQSLEIYDATFIKEIPTGTLYRKSMNKLDDSYNVPRFYTIYFEVPKLSVFNGDKLSQELQEGITEGLSTVISHELQYLANRLEQIDGVQMQLIQRFDIGPFYNKFTENTEAINKLLENADPSEGIISLTKNYVLRESQVPITGIKNSWKAMFSGDDQRGIFSDILSKRYMIMPNRLVQKATKQSIKLGNVELIGVTKEGDFS